jgi:inorganic pyrophosphatase
MVVSGLLVGAMLPYVFSGMTMKSVGLAAMTMVRASLRPSPAAAAVCLTAPLCR